MAVSVRIEDEAFGDRRYDVLAQILGLPDADCARGKMAAVWRQCTQETTHVLSGEMVRAILGENGPDALLKSCLGEPVEGGIRIRGTRGRIEWLAKLRKNGKKGGRPRKPTGNQMVPQTGTNREPEPNPPAPAPAPTNKEEDPLSDVALARSLARRILQNNPKHKFGTFKPEQKESLLAEWSNDVRLMRERDNRTPTEIAAVIAWCQGDSFWRSNILSTSSLRRQFDALLIKMGDKAPKRPALVEQPPLVFVVGGIEVAR